MDVPQHDREVAKVSEKLEKSLSMDTDDKMEAHHRFAQEGKDVALQGDLVRALQLFKRAHDLHPSEKLERRIKKIEELVAERDLEEEEEEEDDEEFVNVNDSGLMLFRELYDKLYDYQRNGVAFLYGLHRDGLRGGILADDMGLGKTIQVISFLSGMYDSELVKNTLLVMPTSLITNWTKEFAKWTPGMRVKEFHGSSKVERTRNLEKVQRRGGVVITTYTMLMNNWQQLSSYHGNEFSWDYMILDEAHKIKTSTTKTAKSASAVPSKNRVLLTGTPVQNNLREMWALFDFACNGTLLGTAKTFKTEYENPITRAREKDATPGEKALGSRMSENLMAIIRPYFLRRTKSEVQKSKMNADTRPREEERQIPDPPEDSGAAMPTLMRKNDLIVWTYLSAVQEDIYRQFISLDHIKELLLTSRSPLAELTILKKLCDHPRLLSAGAIAKLGLEESSPENQEVSDTHSIANVPDDTLISESGKLVFLFQLLEQLRAEGHRVLVFAHYRKVLDIIQHILNNRGFKVLRLDGTITKIVERERLITLFQTDQRYSVFLLTTQVGGVGITLTAADRVVIYDPSWNPATDAQAVDRAYRIGQTENVVIYRLITCGSVEEKIYRRQVFKDSLIRQNTGDKKNPFRYFSKQELKELFTLEETRSSSTQLQLQALHSRHRQTDPQLDQHIARLHAMDMFGISDHDLMFSLDINHDEALQDQQEHHYIEGRVKKAQELMEAESEVQMQLAESMASSTEPAWLRRPADAPRERSHERQPRSPTPSPLYPQHDNDHDTAPVVVELDCSGSGGEAVQQNPSRGVIDLTADMSMTETADASQDELSEQNHQSVEEDAPREATSRSVDEAEGDADDASVMELIDQSAAGEGGLSYVTAVDEEERLQNGSSLSAMEEEAGHRHATPPQNNRLSVLQASNSSFRDSSSRVGLESLEGNFHLQLEDSDAFSDDDEVLEVLDPLQTDEDERKLLSRLQLQGSFDVNKSLCAKQQEEAQSSDGGRALEKYVNDSLVVEEKKKKAAVIYDTDEEEDERQLEVFSPALGVSTPKSAPSGSTPLRSRRRSVGGNTSVASRRSLLNSVIEDLVDEEDKDDDEEAECSEIHSEEDDAIDSSNGLQLDETLNTEEEEESMNESLVVTKKKRAAVIYDSGEEEEEVEEEEEDVTSKSGEESSINLEESTSDPELASTEGMDQYTVDAGVKTDGAEEDDESYDWLVARGRRSYSQGKLDDALGFFLRAIDLRPGDPEVQLMTIQLYRQLSQRR